MNFKDEIEEIEENEENNRNIQAKRDVLSEIAYDNFLATLDNGFDGDDPSDADFDGDEPSDADFDVDSRDGRGNAVSDGTYVSPRPTMHVMPEFTISGIYTVLKNLEQQTLYVGADATLDDSSMPPATVYVYQDIYIKSCGSLFSYNQGGTLGNLFITVSLSTIMDLLISLINERNSLQFLRWRLIDA